MARALNARAWFGGENGAGTNPAPLERVRYRGVIRPPNLSCSDSATRGKRVE